jgi:hypothetical protein
MCRLGAQLAKQTLATQGDQKGQVQAGMRVFRYKKTDAAVVARLAELKDEAQTAAVAGPLPWAAAGFTAVKDPGGRGNYDVE